MAKEGRRIRWAAAALWMAIIGCSVLTSGPGLFKNNSHSIQTAVSGTVQALNPAEPSGPAGSKPPLNQNTPAPPLPVPGATPTGQTSLLPAKLYFLGPDRGGRDQLWRLSIQGNRAEALTAEPGGVSDYAVSSAGTVVYLVGNRLFMLRPGFSGTLMIADGGANDGSDSFRYRQEIAGIAWAPDGNSLAYGLDGIHLYDVSTGKDSLVLQNEITRLNGADFPAAMYAPDKWSPDGSLLAVRVTYAEGGSEAVYEAAQKRLLRLNKPDGSPVSCCSTAWTPDGKALLSAGVAYGAAGADLWRYPVDGKAAVELVPPQAQDGRFSAVDWPIQSPDGILYYFYASSQANPMPGKILYQAVRSGADGTSRRTILQPDPQLIIEALWAPNGSLAVVVLGTPGGNTSLTAQNGTIAVLFTDGREMKQIVVAGRRLAWGPSGEDYSPGSSNDSTS